MTDPAPRLLDSAQLNDLHQLAVMVADYVERKVDPSVRPEAVVVIGGFMASALQRFRPPGDAAEYEQALAAFRRYYAHLLAEHSS
jgi:hypothetical protein